jgi:hypothetical protein
LAWPVLGMVSLLARAEAKRLLGEIAAGRYPASERNKKNDETLADLFDQFMAQHVRTKLKPSTAYYYKLCFMVRSCRRSICKRLLRLMGR